MEKNCSVLDSGSGGLDLTPGWISELCSQAKHSILKEPLSPPKSINDYRWIAREA